jgi:hypothetical protein
MLGLADGDADGAGLPAAVGVGLALPEAVGAGTGGLADVGVEMPGRSEPLPDGEGDWLGAEAAARVVSSVASPMMRCERGARATPDSPA